MYSIFALICLIKSVASSDIRFAFVSVLFSVIDILFRYRITAKIEIPKIPGGVNSKRDFEEVDRNG